MPATRTTGGPSPTTSHVIVVPSAEVAVALIAGWDDRQAADSSPGGRFEDGDGLEAGRVPAEGRHEGTADDEDDDGVGQGAGGIPGERRRHVEGPVAVEGLAE